MNVMIVPFGTGVGDMILQRPFFNAVVRSYSGQQVQVYAPRSVQPLLPVGVQAVPRILGIPAWRRVHAERAWRLFGPLEQRAIDAVFDATSLASMARLPARLLTASNRYVATIDLMGAFLTCVDFERDWLPPPVGTREPHLTQRLERALRGQGLNVEPADFAPLSIPAQDATSAATLRRTAPADYVVIHPHAGSPLKANPASLWATIVTESARRGLTPLITAGATPAESKLAHSIAGAAGHVLPAASLFSLASLSTESRAIIAPDTGLLSLAASVGAPWVGLFGATNPYLVGPRETHTGMPLISPFVHSRSCTHCWQRFVVGSGLCPPSPGSSCLGSFLATDIVEVATRLPHCPDNQRG